MIKITNIVSKKSGKTLFLTADGYKWYFKDDEYFLFEEDIRIPVTFTIEHDDEKFKELYNYEVVEEKEQEKKAMKAPKEVIDFLNSVRFDEETVYSVFSENGPLGRNCNDLLSDWVYDAFDSKVVCEREIGIVKHLLGLEKLEQIRADRFYVEFKNNFDITSYVVFNPAFNIKIENEKPTSFQLGITHHMAKKAQAMYGGEIKEIK